jgi:hypothetical protein
VNQLDVILRGMIALGLLPALALAGESGRLTIGGYVPPMQRIAAVQPRTTAGGLSVMVLEEQNNSALGYNVTIESQAPGGQSKTSPCFQLKCDGQPVNFTGNRTILRHAPGRSGRRPATRILEVSAVPTRSDTVLILTVATQ